MRVDRLYLKDTGPFRELDVVFQPKVAQDKADLHLFVGPNGSGKTTLLYAIAEMFSLGQLGPSRLQRRMTTGQAKVATRIDGSTALLLAQSETVGLRSGTDPWSDVRVGWVGGINGAILFSDVSGHLRSVQLTSTTPLDASHRFAFAAFAYAGQRVLTDYSLTAIVEPSLSPFANALSFTHTVDTSQLAQWIANSHAKEAFALRDGNELAARRYAEARSHIENAAREVVGEDVRFEFRYEPLGVTLRRGPTTLPFDLLPDGVKSILSWLADLLMRLDRIPWVDDTPLLQRRFLLLLDEVDIHLHPAWQRKVLPMVQHLFPNAQVFVTTHSPFVVASVSDAWVYPLSVRDGVATMGAAVPTQAGTSYAAVTKSIFGVEEDFDVETEAGLSNFYALRNAVLGGDRSRYAELRSAASALAARGVEVEDIVASEVAQVDAQLRAMP